jgi:hypothetical protein
MFVVSALLYNTKVLAEPDKVCEDIFVNNDAKKYNSTL